MENKSQFESFELGMNDQIIGFLKETSTWTYFLSILGFIGIGLMVIFGLLFGTIMGSAFAGGNNPYESLGFSAGYLGLIYVVIALIYFFPVLYLFNFSRKMKKALASNNNEDLKSAFSNLKSHYKYMGIFAIIILSMYVLLFLFGMFGAMM